MIYLACISKECQKEKVVDSHAVQDSSDKNSSTFDYNEKRTRHAFAEGSLIVSLLGISMVQ